MTREHESSVAHVSGTLSALAGILDVIPHPHITATELRELERRLDVALGIAEETPNPKEQ